MTIGDHGILWIRRSPVTRKDEEEDRWVSFGDFFERTQREERKAIDEARKQTQRRGIVIGQTVAHESDDKAYVVKSIAGEEVEVWIPGDAPSIKKFPLRELFDPSIYQAISNIPSGLLSYFAGVELGIILQSTRDASESADELS